MSASYSMTTSIPLTTTFTPSPSCLSDYYTTNSFISLGPPSTSACLPPGWQLTSQYFSPGLCPSGYVIACLTTDTLGSLTETRATCCPSSYTCQSRSDWPWFSTEPCSRDWDNFPEGSIFYITSTVGSSTTVISGPLEGGGVNAYGISIRWQSQDFPATTTSITSNTPSPSFSPTSSVPSTSSLPTSFYPSVSPTPSATASQGLSPGAAAGIGVVVTVISLALVAAAILFILRHRRRSKLEPTSPLQTERYRDGLPELENAGVRDQHELYGEVREFEVDAGTVYSDDWRGSRVVESPSGIFGS
jgi:hypothetical protein